MRKMGNVVGNVEELRREREARLNPPEYEAGQGDDDGWDFFDDGGDCSMDESAFGGSSDVSSAGGGSLGSGFGGDLGSLGGAFGGSVQQSPLGGSSSGGSAEDRFFDGVVGVFRCIAGGCRSLFGGFSAGLGGADAFFWTVYGKRVMVVGVWVSVAGGILSLLGFVSVISGGFWVLVGGLLCVALGVLVFSMNCDKAREIGSTKEKKEEIDFSEYGNSSEGETDLFEEEEGSSWGDLDDDGNYSDGFSDDSFAEEEDYDPWAGINDSAWGGNNDSSSVSSVSEPVGGVVDIDSAISSIRDIPAYTHTRRYLYEEYSRVLPVINPEFARLKNISENSDDFIIFDKVLRDASVQVGTHEDKIPELLELRENQFIIQIKASRPSGLKEDDIADEIANIYSRDEYGGVIHEGVYAMTSSVGSYFIINIFKGENSIISLADTYREVSEFVLNPKVKKPVIMGVNELGKVWYFDAEKVFSYIISGKPRSGKSWSVVSLVLQLCMYSSPREVCFEVFDVKGTSSDYYSMRDYLPHFKRFESNGARILSRLRHLVTVEADRRKKILEANNVIAIADLKDKGVDVDIPYLYVLIDEIVGLIGTFSKEEHAEFKDLLNVLITQMPNLGIRLILVPHRVTNDIVPKTTYTNVGCIACVRSDGKEIINTLDITKKDFPYDLNNSGDMALKTGEVNKGKTVFCHGIAITSSNESNVGIYRFVGSLWGKLEPDCSVSGDVSKASSVRVEEYKGHELVGVDSFDSGVEDDEEDFWNSL